jgi:hypothetical protein
MVVGMVRSFYKAPCRWYPGGPIGEIRFYEALPTASWFMDHTVFHPYSQVLQLENKAMPGEITGHGLRIWDAGVNTNQTPGDHYEGTLDDFIVFCLSRIWKIAPFGLV